MVDFRSLIPWREPVRTPATRDDLFDPFVSFRREVDRMFDSFFDGLGGRQLTHAGWPALTPAIDVAETDKDMLVTVEVPGVAEKDIEVTLAGDVLTVRGEKKSERDEKNGDFTYAERRYGSFTRSVRLPFEAAEDGVDAKYDKGVLTIRVPKPAEAQKSVKRIEVKST